MSMYYSGNYLSGVDILREICVGTGSSIVSLVLALAAASLLSTAVQADDPPRRVLSFGDILPCDANPCAYLVSVYEDMVSGEDAFANISAIVDSHFVELVQANKYSGEQHACMKAMKPLKITMP
jgi:hypothetical protein